VLTVLRPVAAQTVYSVHAFSGETGGAPRRPADMVRTPGGKRMVSINGKPTPLFWADHITDIDDLDEYARTGFNTIVVQLTWRPTSDGALVAGDWEPQRAFADAAAQRGLFIVYSLPPAPMTQERAFRFAADDEAYFTMWSTWVEGVIAALKDTPNLIGWMLPDDPRSLPYTDDNGFLKWLKANIVDVGRINRLWGVHYDKLEDVTIASIQELTAAWRGGGGLPDLKTPEDVNAYIAQMRKRPDRQNFVVHPAALALAAYRWDAYRGLIDAWARTIKEVDPAHLVISGRLTDYAQLLSVSPHVDISVCEVRPDIAEGDFITHNPQQIDVARRGNRFAAIPVLSTSGSNVVPEDAIPHLMQGWADTALAHGAAGLIVDSWQDLRDHTEIHRAVREALRRLTTQPYVDLWQQAPVATIAVVLTPLADGHTLQPPAGLPVEPRGLYGFGTDMVEGEPSFLVYSLRWGTAYGGVDYYSPDDFDGTGATLAHYSAVLLPQALSVPPPMLAELAQFVSDGGVAVADLGLGAAQMGYMASAIPPALASLFGVQPVMQIEPLTFNLRTIRPHPLLPHWNSVTTSQGGALLTAGDGPAGAAFVGPLGFSDLLRDTQPLALAFERPIPLNSQDSD
jgi:hypothetical protein